MSTIDIQTFKPTNQQKFIIDTNVLIKLLYPTMSGKNTIPYEKLYQSIVKSNAEIIISSIQISEFVNRCIRFQFSLWVEDGNPDSDFKSDYRETDDYKNSMQAILEIIKSDILPISTCIDDGFSRMNADALYQYGFSYDFNDSLVAEIARLNDAILITDDRDFGVGQLRVLDLDPSGRCPAQPTGTGSQSHHQGELCRTALATPLISLEAGSALLLACPLGLLSYSHGSSASSTVLLSQSSGSTFPSTAACKGLDQFFLFSHPTACKKLAHLCLHYKASSTMLPRQGARPAFQSSIASEGAGVALPLSFPWHQVSQLLELLCM